MIHRRTVLTIPPLVALTTVLSAPEALASTYTDVPSNHPFHKEITWATSHKYILPTGATTFTPEGTIDRKTLATTFYTYWGKPSYNPPATPYFKDVPPIHPQYKEISWCVRRNLINGWEDKTFRPMKKLTGRQQPPSSTDLLDHHNTPRQQLHHLPMCQLTISSIKKYAGLKI